MKTKRPVIAVFDIGKTNKKLLVFDAEYNVVLEKTTAFVEQTDEDGFPCEDIDSLSAWILDHFEHLKKDTEFDLRAVNFSTYGASVVYLDANGKRVAPLYNYLKPYPPGLLNQFYQEHGQQEKIAVETSSPIMGHLNAGLQVYWLKHKRPALYEKTSFVLHFPQYLSYILTGKKIAEMTNVGCHSAMWNFGEMSYHKWVEKEGILNKLSPVVRGNGATTLINEHEKNPIAVGIGLHDSSAAIIPYLASFTDPFVIVSTGTWMISLNPFNSELPKMDELNKGCVSYLTYTGDPVKVSMLFAGHDHDQQVKRIAAHFNLQENYFKSLPYDFQIANSVSLTETSSSTGAQFNAATDPCFFHLRDLSAFKSPEHAYHCLVQDIINRQSASIKMILNNSVKNIYADGGFCKNTIYMQLLTDAFPGIDVKSTSMMQGTALGAALAIHDQWNDNPLPRTLINLKNWPKSVLVSN